MEPYIKEKYINIADGTKLVFYNPTHRCADENGFFICTITAGYYNKKNNNYDKRLRIISTEDKIINNIGDLGESTYVYTEGDTILEWWSLTRDSIIKSLSSVKECDEFRGWMNSKCTRAFKTELSTATKGKIFTFHLKYT